MDRLLAAGMQYGEKAAVLLNCICPACSGNISYDSPKRLFLQAHPLPGGSPRNSPWPPLQKGELNAGYTLFLLFVSSVFISLVANTYSLAAKVYSLPNLPFNYYLASHIVIGLSSYIFFRTTNRDIVALSWNSLIYSIIMVLPITFFVPSFRNVFYSQFSTKCLEVVITPLFILALCVEFQLIKLGVSRVNYWPRFSLLVRVIILLSFVTPFYLSVVKINRTADAGTIMSVKAVKVFHEKMAHSEAGRRYFIDGKEYAAKGNRAGFIKSIQLYRMALELIPNFSSAYAEMAYSYASIARILDEAGAEKRRIEECLKRAEDAIRQVKTINHRNPTVFAVDLLVQYIIAKHYLSHKWKHKLSHDKFHQMRYKIEWSKADGLDELRKLAENVGLTDKVCLAEAILTENRIKKGSSLLTILEKFDSDNAEVHNLLGLVYYLVNDKDSAKKMFERAKKLSPDFGKPYINLAIVYPKKEASRLYIEASHKDGDLKSLTIYYCSLFKVQKWLWRFYVGLAIVFGAFTIVIKYPIKSTKSQINPEATKKFSTLRFRCNLLFIITYGAFEIYIHFIRPINGIDYMFPIGFPFF
jgi:tetratricopeptide (TPR) repeat protein